jgi:mRNA-degrading endonuclease RelE of RelBE toxin-antitoxin system
MDKLKKFQRKIDAALRMRIESVAEKITLNQLEGLDIKPLTGQDNLFRCRVGKVRIIFQRTKQGNLIRDIGFRGSMYR